MTLLNFSPIEIKRKIECDKKSRDRDMGNEISKRSTLRGEKRVNRICSGRDCEERKRTARDGGRNFAQPRNSSFRALWTIPHVCTRVSENSAAKMLGKNVVVCEGRASAFRQFSQHVINPFILVRYLHTFLTNFAKAICLDQQKRKKEKIDP